MNNDTVIIKLNKNFPIKFGIKEQKYLESKFRTSSMGIFDIFATITTEDLVDVLFVGINSRATVIETLDELEALVDEFSNSFDVLEKVQEALMYAYMGVARTKEQKKVLENERKIEEKKINTGIKAMS